jgi:hypothetical protein
MLPGLNLNSGAQVTLFPHPSEYLGLVCATMPSYSNSTLQAHDLTEFQKQPCRCQ